MKFIASAGPTISTVEYFLRAIWDNDVDVIVMLNNPNADTEVGGQYRLWQGRLSIRVPLPNKHSHTERTGRNINLQKYHGVLGLAYTRWPMAMQMEMVIRLEYRRYPNLSRFRNVYFRVHSPASSFGTVDAEK